MLLGAIVASRLLFLLVRVPLLVGSEKYYDYRHFLLLARLTDDGHYPFLDYWMEYPPLFPWLSVGLYRLAGAIATGTGPMAGDEFWFYALSAGVRAGAEILTVLLLLRLAVRLYGPRRANVCLLLYSLFFFPYYLWNGAFDPIPTALLLLGFHWLLHNRTGLSALSAALGFLAKIFPGLLLPLALFALPGRRALAYLAIFGLCVAAGLLPFLLLAPQPTGWSLQVMATRSSWETVWALLDGRFGPGAVASVSQRFAPPAAAEAATGSGLSLLVAGGLALLGGAVLLRLRRSASPARLLAAGGFFLHGLLLYSPGYSPQFFTWAAPLLALVFPNWYGAGYLLLWAVANALEFPLYFSLLPHWTGLLIAAVLLRTAVLVVSLGHYFAIATGRLAPVRSHPLERPATR